MAAMLTSCTGTQTTNQPGNPEEEMPKTEVFVLRKTKLASTIQLPGELIAFQQVDLYAKVNSFVKKLYVDVGSQVKPGELLAVLEAPEINSELAGADSRLKAQEALYAASKANYDRLVETSKTPGTIAPNDLDQAAAKKNADLDQLESARSAYQEIAENKKYLEIRAPFGGVISSRNVNQGATVGPSGKGSELPLFTLQEQNKLRLTISVPESFTANLKKSIQVDFTVKSLPEEVFHATISRMAGALDTKLRSERIEMDVTNLDKKLLPGMVAEVKLSSPSKDSTFVIPKMAMVNSTEKIFVIKISGGLAKWVNVKNGLESNGKLEIFGDLQAGDTLVARPSEELRDGSSVSIGKLIKP